jgi:hypothetical protein
MEVPVQRSCHENRTKKEADGQLDFAAERVVRAAGKSGETLNMSSKGVDYYGYLGDKFGCGFLVPAYGGRENMSYGFAGAPLKMQTGSAEIDSADVQNFVGRFQWSIGGPGIDSSQSWYADINCVTGNLDGFSNNVGVMMQLTSTCSPPGAAQPWALSMGFYDAGTGSGGLTNRDQCYVYLTQGRSTWMGDLVKATPALSKQPFSVFALPGAHDAGTFDLGSVQSLAQNAAFLALLAPATGWAAPLLIALATTVGPSAIVRLVTDLAVTQKDNTETLCNLGVRYFDFRPGHCDPTLLPYGPVSDTYGIYHQHTFIPGHPYDMFLNEVLTWLGAHPTEIIVISLNFQRVPSSMQPSLDTLNSLLSAALSGPNGDGIAAGNKNDLNSTYAALLAANKRLIFLNQINATDDAKKYDSYSDALYQTTDVTNILTALNGKNKAGQVGNDYTVLQLQGTPNALASGIFSSIATLSDASSPMMSTKPGFDYQTYSWLIPNVQNNLNPSQLVILLNDFCDNALSGYAASITSNRSQLYAASQAAGQAAAT